MVDYARFQTLQVEREGKVLMVTLNRPEALNAVSPQMHRELEDIFAEITQDEDTNAVLLTGAGRAFCAGGDVKGMAGREPQPLTVGKGAKRLIASMLAVEQPIIAAMNGDAVGLGATIALFCDVVIAAEKARIGDTHVRVGVVAGDGGAVIWPLLVGLSRAKEYLMTGNLMLAAEAERLGLINRVVPAEELLTTAKELAHQLANMAPYAVRWTKTSVNKVLRERVNLVLETSLALESLTFATEDHKEAARAFVEKRVPVFKGR